MSSLSSVVMISDGPGSPTEVFIPASVSAVTTVTILSMLLVDFSEISAICVVELISSSPTPSTSVILSTPSVEVSVTSTECVVVFGPPLLSSAILDIRMSKSGRVSSATDSVVIWFSDTVDNAVEVGIVSLCVVGGDISSSPLEGDSVVSRLNNGDLSVMPFSVDGDNIFTVETSDKESKLVSSLFDVRISEVVKGSVVVRFSISLVVEFSKISNICVVVGFSKISNICVVGEVFEESIICVVVGISEISNI